VTASGGTGVGVTVGVLVGVAVGAAVGVAVGVTVGVAVGGTGVTVGVGVATAVQDAPTTQGAIPTVNEHAPVPLHFPVHPLKVYPEFGDCVRSKLSSVLDE
jgi:hypothetical protein